MIMVGREIVYGQHITYDTQISTKSSEDGFTIDHISSPAIEHTLAWDFTANVPEQITDLQTKFKFTIDKQYAADPRQFLEKYVWMIDQLLDFYEYVSGLPCVDYITFSIDIDPECGGYEPNVGVYIKPVWWEQYATDDGKDNFSKAQDFEDKVMGRTAGDDIDRFFADRDFLWVSRVSYVWVHVESDYEYKMEE
jgi:hypothetical protein